MIDSLRRRQVAYLHPRRWTASIVHFFPSEHSRAVGRKPMGQRQKTTPKLWMAIDLFTPMAKFNNIRIDIGRTLSRMFTSVANRFSIRPEGVWSKKLIGSLMIRLSRTQWKIVEAFRHAIASVTDNVMLLKARNKSTHSCIGLSHFLEIQQGSKPLEQSYPANNTHKKNLKKRTTQYHHTLPILLHYTD